MPAVVKDKIFEREGRSNASLYFSGKDVHKFSQLLTNWILDIESKHQIKFTSFHMGFDYTSEK